MARFRRLIGYLRDLRVVLWFLVLFAALFASDRASAGDFYGPNNAGYTRWDAWAACNAADNGAYYTHCFETTANAPYAGAVCGRPTANGVFNCWYYNATACASGTVWNATSHTCAVNTAAEAACNVAPGIYSTMQLDNGSIFCFADQCLKLVTSAGDGSEILIAPLPKDVATSLGLATNVCSTGSPLVCPSSYTQITVGLVTRCLPSSGDADGDGLTNQTDPTPTTPGNNVVDSDGDGTPDNADPFPNDATNGKNLAAGETRNTSSGGGNCTTPPVSNGDAIAAQVAYQTWATRCAVERMATQAHADATASSSGGLSSADSAKLSSIQSNTGATATNTAIIANALTDTEGGEGDLASRGNDGMPASGDAAGHGQEVTFGEDGLDTSGFGAGSTCPALPTVMVNAMPVDIDITLFCTFAQVCGALVLVFASVACVKILGS